MTDIDDFYEVNRTGADLAEITTPTDTFVALHKDILLEPTEQGRYDRVVTADDFVIVEGLASYQAAVRIKLCTWYNEMSDDPSYVGWGNRAWFYLKSNNTELDKLGITSQIVKAIDEMNRTKEVNDIELFEYFPTGVNNPSLWVVETMLTAISDQSAKITEGVVANGL
jgi:hypothetical protein